MWNDAPADASATAELERAEKENYRFAWYCLIGAFSILGVCLCPSLLVLIVTMCTSFLDCWPVRHFGIIVCICRSWCKSRNGSFHYTSLTKILILLLLCSSLSTNFGKKGLEADFETALGPKSPNDAMCTLNWLENDPTPRERGAERAEVRELPAPRAVHEQVRRLDLWRCFAAPSIERV